MRSVYRCVSLSALLAGAVAPSSAVVVIDNFTQGATNLTITASSGFAESQQGSINVAGTQRDVLLRVTSNPFLETMNFEIVPSLGMGFYSSASAIVGSVALDYDGVDAEDSDGVQTAGPGLDLNLSGESFFRFNFAFADQGTQARIDAYTYEGGKQSSANFTVAAGITTSTDLDILFSSFTPVSGGGVSFADVDRLVVTFNGNNAATDFALTSITAVPEPASMAALALGGLGLLARRKSRK